MPNIYFITANRNNNFRLSFNKRGVMKKLVIVLAATFSLLIISATAQAASYSSQKDGGWSDPCTWNQGSPGNCPGNVPGSGDSVQITHTVSGTGFCQSLMLIGTINGSVSVSGPATIAGGTVGANAYLIVGGETSVFDGILNGLMETKGIRVEGTFSGSGSISVVGSAPATTVLFINNGTVAVYNVIFGYVGQAFDYGVTGTGSFNLGNSFEISGSNRLNISGAGTISASRLAIGSGSTLFVNTALTFSGGPMSVQNSGSSLVIGSGSLTFNGTNFVNTTTVDIGSSTFNFNGTGTFINTGTIAGTGTVKFAPSDGTAVFAHQGTNFAPGVTIASGTVEYQYTGAINGPLVIDAGATLALNGNLTVNNNVTVNGTLTTVGSSFPALFFQGGTFTNNGAVTGNVSVTFGIFGSNPPVAQNLAGTGDWTGSRSLSIQFSTTTMLNDVTFNGGSLFVASRINTGAFTLSVPCTVAWDGGGDVVGNVRRTNLAACPGAVIAYGSPFTTIQFTSGTPPTEITVNVALAPPSSFPSAVNRTYLITPTGGSGYTATLRLHYLDAELNGNDESTLQLWRYDGASWNAQGATNRNTTDNWVEYNNVTQFSPWTLSSSSPPTPAPSAPNAPDLQVASDTGASNTDNITNDTTPTFDISGVNAGATVELLRGGTVVASGNASGTTISLTDTSVPSDGAYSYTARQTTSGGTSNQSAALSITIDTTQPSVTINQAAGQTDPTSSSPINFTVVFSESVSGFTSSDVQLSGTANATTALVTGAGTTYNVAVSGMTTSGTVIATIPAGGATDAAGNANTVSTSTDNSVTYNAPVAPQFTSGTPPNGTVGVAYTFTFTASGNPSSSFSKTVGTLPPGLTLSTSGVLSGTPATAGNYTFTVKASNGVAPDATQQFTIRITGTPVASNDAYNTAEDTALTVTAPGVLTNDTDAAGNTLTASIVAQPTHGTLTLNPDGSFNYTPAANYNGADSFTYRANNGTNNSNTATVAITVTAVNDAPVAVNDSYDALGTSTLNIPAPGVLTNDTDVEGSALTAILVSAPTKGTLNLNANGSFTYKPNSNTSATDSFTYRANDGSADSNVATVTINVIPQPTLSVDLTAFPSGVAVPDGSTLIAGRAICINATVRDASGNPADASVSFQISGANNATAVRSTAAGVAQYCYTDAAVGTDTIRVTTGALVQQRTVIWEKEVARLKGLVLDSASRAGIANASITLQGPGAVFTAKTIADGSYSFDDLPIGGPYKLKASATGYAFSELNLGDLPQGLTTAPDVLGTKQQVDPPGFAGSFICQLFRALLGGFRNTPFSAHIDAVISALLKSIGCAPANAKNLYNLSDATVIQNGPSLEIQPLDGIDGYHFGGLVTPEPFRLTNNFIRVELAQATNPDAQTMFGVLSDNNNWFRFVVTGDETALTSDDDLSHGSTGPQRLYMQAKVNGVKSLTSIPYDAAQQRFLRFRHDLATNTLFFETSADGQSWNAQRTIILPEGISLDFMLAELSAGTAKATNDPGKAQFTNLEVGVTVQTPTIKFDADLYTASENDGSIQITVTRTGSTSGAASVRYATSDGTATGGSDYTATFGTLHFADGETSKTFTVSIINDTLKENNETVNLTLSDVGGSAALGSPAIAVLTITDEDAPVIQFSAPVYSFAENGGSTQITVTRAGDASGAATINYATTDSAGLNPCNLFNGIASQRCDYALSIGTLRFAAGETSKTIFIPIVDDAYAEGAETFSITLSNPSGLTLGSTSTATITITDNESVTGTNPLDGNAFFVRQHYIDFLGREPEPAGLAGWLNVLNNCGVTIAQPCDRIEVSSGFFRSEEFQTRGYFVYRFYSIVGRIPLYNEFMPDFAKVSGFLSPEQLEANKVAFVSEFMTRADYQTRYGSITDPTAYVTALLQTLGLPNHPGKANWISSLTSGAKTKAQVLREVTESTEVYQKYYTEAFVIMQYFGYLRRSADGSYVNWIQTMNSTGGDYRIMINGFMNSEEYRKRFGP
jgi:VCBS repeat-containing protein